MRHAKLQKQLLIMNDEYLDCNARFVRFTIDTADGVNTQDNALMLIVVLSA